MNIEQSTNRHQIVPQTQKDPTQEFLEAMREAGCEPENGQVLADDKLHRYQIAGQRRGGKNGAYRLAIDHADGFAYGWFHDWTQSDDPTGWHSGGSQDLEPEERQRRQDRVAHKKAQAEREREQAQREAADKAKERWQAASLEGASAYLDRKQIGPHGVRFQGDDILVPVMDGGDIVSLQAINPDGSKQFMKGGKVSGGYFAIAGTNEEIAIAEGFATAASVHEATGWTTLVAFNAGNLEKVARKTRAKFPDAEIIIAGDADEAGKRHGDQAAKAVNGRAMYPPTGDWNDLHVAEGLRAVTEALDDPLTVSAATFQGKPIPPREWLVRDWIPGREVTLLYGDGGTGKSLVALQLAVSVALATKRNLQTWLSLPVMAGKAVYIGAEDEQDEMQRRLASILKSEGAEFSDLENLEIRSLAGEDALLAKEQRDKPLSTSPLYQRIERTLRQHRPAVLVLDTLSDMYPANENDRAKVKQFANLLKRLALKHECAVIMLAHPSRDGMNSGRGDSGSTAWNGAARSRLYLEFLRLENGDIEPLCRVLSSKKNNFSFSGASMNLNWNEGCFAAQPGETMLDRKAMHDKAERVFLELLRQYTEIGDVPTASRTATVFSKDDDCDGVKKKGFERAQMALLKSGAIEICEDGPPSRRRKYLRIKEPNA
ncbi:MAG: AAA family ATPase [Rhodobacteraceae bacterium]|nr:AAA family ATPase [Paracoccaceae bacterium]